MDRHDLCHVVLYIYMSQVIQDDPQGMPSPSSQGVLSTTHLSSTYNTLASIGRYDLSQTMNYHFNMTKLTPITKINVDYRAWQIVQSHKAVTSYPLISRNYYVIMGALRIYPSLPGSTLIL